MSDPNNGEPKTMQIQFTAENSIGVGCPTCSAATKDQRLDVTVHLPSANLCVICRRCQRLVSTLGLSLAGYQWAVNSKLAMVEPSRIVKPLGPVRLN